MPDLIGQTVYKKKKDGYSFYEYNTELKWTDLILAL